MSSSVATVSQVPAAFLGQPRDTRSTCRPLNGGDCCPSSEDQEYLCYFYHRHLDFRIPEVEALAQLAGCRSSSNTSLIWRRPYGGVDLSPMWYLRLPSEDVARTIASRSILLKGFLELWGEGADWDELRASIDSYPAARKARWNSPSLSWKMVVEGWGLTIQTSQQVDIIECMAYLGFQGRIDLSNPDVTFHLVVMDVDGNCGMPEMGRRIYFGRQIAMGSRRVVNDYALPKRIYIGPTSMDPELSFIICNQAKVKRGDLVYDPFVGTGSMLVAAAHCGACTLGADIDIRVVRDGKMGADGQPRDNWSNFESYGLPPPLGLLRADAHRPPFREGLEEVFDAVLADPPYGVRAGGKKSVAKPYTIDDPETHIAATEPYTLGECLRDLLDSSARLLRLGGCLCYFMPASPETYREEEIPSHPALAMVANCEQVLTARYSRRLITMEKTSCYNAEAAAQHHEAMGPPLMAIDDITSIVYEERRSENGPVRIRPTAKRRFRSKLT